jgi:hypothetical protein
MNRSFSIKHALSKNHKRQSERQVHPWHTNSVVSADAKRLVFPNGVTHLDPRRTRSPATMRLNEQGRALANDGRKNVQSARLT